MFKHASIKVIEHCSEYVAVIAQVLNRNARVLDKFIKHYNAAEEERQNEIDVLEERIHDLEKRMDEAENVLTST